MVSLEKQVWSVQLMDIGVPYSTLCELSVHLLEHTLVQASTQAQQMGNAPLLGGCVSSCILSWGGPASLHGGKPALAGFNASQFEE